MKPRPRPHLGLFDPDPRLPTGYWRSLAPGTKRVEIEIGSGDGGFLLGAARQEPRTLFVGFESRPGRACKIGPGPNVKVLELDARWVVINILAAGSIDAFHVYFPDPWWKKRHHKRRLFTDEFCAGLRSSMSAEARVFLMTDVESQFANIDPHPNIFHPREHRNEWSLHLIVEPKHRTFFKDLKQDRNEAVDR